jgi:hypothetical protein
VNAHDIIFSRPTSSQVLQRITPFVLDPALDREISQEIDGRAALAQDIAAICRPHQPDPDALLDVIAHDDRALNTVISLLGLSQEGFLRLITLLRIVRGEFDPSDSEWKVPAITNRMRVDREFGRRVVELLLYGSTRSDFSELRALLPDFLARSLDVNKLRVDSTHVIDTLLRKGLKGRFDAKKGKAVENRVSRILNECGVAFKEGEIAIEGLERHMDFVVPHETTPHVAVEVGVFETTARELSEKGLVEARLLEQLQTLYPDAVMVRVVDGIGWIARGGGDLDRVLASSHYALTQRDLDDKLPAIIRHHVPAEFFSQ